MPIYEYRCSGCDHKFEELVRSADEPVACPACANAEVKRLLSVFSSGRDAKSFGGTAGGGCACTPQTCGCR